MRLNDYNWGQRWHVVFRSVAVAMGITATVWSTVYDYAWGTDLYWSVVSNANYWVHEQAVIWGLVFTVVFADLLYCVLVTLQAALNAFITLEGSPLDEIPHFKRFVRRIKRKGP